MHKYQKLINYLVSCHKVESKRKFCSKKVLKKPGLFTIIECICCTVFILSHHGISKLVFRRIYGTCIVSDLCVGTFTLKVHIGWNTRVPHIEIPHIYTGLFPSSEGFSMVRTSATYNLAGCDTINSSKKQVGYTMSPS